jgi:hypothetical protein
MEKVLALTNSATRYGMGFMFALFAKAHMKGVNVKMSMSFDVNTVRMEMTA